MLRKPVNNGELVSNIEIAIHNYKTQKEDVENSKFEGINDL